MPPSEEGPCHSASKFAVVVVLSVAALLAGNYRQTQMDDGNGGRYALVSRKSDLAKSSSLSRRSILPRKIYSVIGLESSGTQFVSKVIQDALGTGPYREGSAPCHMDGCDVDDVICQRLALVQKDHECDEDSDVIVQHFSLPWGSTCQQRPNPPVLDVVLPPQCSRDHGDDPAAVRECNEMATDIWGVRLDGKAMAYPPRYHLDIVKSKEWYDARGVEQVFVIVVRDEKISFAARHGHCDSVELRRAEEEVGTGLIADAINRYILGDGASAESAKFLRWNGKDQSRRRRKLGALASRDNVVVVSYESLVKLSGTYVKMLYEALGIESDVVPAILNSNEKYLNTTLVV